MVYIGRYTCRCGDSGRSAGSGIAKPFCQKGSGLPTANCRAFVEMRCATMSRWRTFAPRCCPTYAVIAVTGRDARSFLQGQLSNDILGLERHPGMLAASCNRQGRVLATLRLAADGDDVLLVLHRKLAPTLVAQLSAFVLRADVRFEDRSRLFEVAGLLDAEPDAHWSQAAAAAAGLAMMVASPRRILLAGTRPALDAALAAIPRTPARGLGTRAASPTASRR